MTTAAIYVRVSTEEQARKGYSLDGQLSQCREHASLAGAIHIEDFIDDGYSGEFLDRPALERLRSGLKDKTYDLVVCYDPDRLARKLAHQLIITDEIEKSGAKLQFVNVTFEQSPEGKLFYSIRGAVAEFEKEKIRERTTGGKRRKALQGKLTFHDKPFGYEPDKKHSNYKIVDYEAEIVRLIYQLLIDNQYGVRSLAWELNSRGIVTRAGKPFSGSVIHKMITNPMYSGTKMAFRKQYKTIGQHKIKAFKRDESEWVPIPVPAIVSEETWQNANDILNNNAKFNKRNTKNDYLLRNIIKCDSCGYTMTAVKKISRGKSFYYYVCPSKGERRPCDNRNIPAAQIDAEFWEYLKGLAKKNKLSTIYRVADNGEKTDLLKKQLDSLTQKQSAILGWVSDGTVSIDAAGADLKKIANEITAVKSAMAVKRPPRKPPNTSAAEILKADTFEQRRGLIKDLEIKVIARRNDAGEIIFYLSP